MLGMAGVLMYWAASSILMLMSEAAKTDTDEDLMLRYRDGNAAAFDVLYARHKGGTYRYCLRQCANKAEAEEVFQELWISLINARTGYTVQARFSTWLYTLAHHRLVDFFRSRGHLTLVAIESESDDDEHAPMLQVASRESDNPAQQLALKQEALTVLEWIDALPAPQREAFILQQETDMSIDEIAAATGTTRETTKSRLRYAMYKLRSLHQQHFDEASSGNTSSGNASTGAENQGKHLLKTEVAT